MFPKADIPVIMVSIDQVKSPKDLSGSGRKPKCLRDENFMVFASGNIVHHLGMVNRDMDNGYGWTDTFDVTFRKTIQARDFETILSHENLPDSKKAVMAVRHLFLLFPR